MPKPRGLTRVTVAMAFLTTVGLLYWDPATGITGFAVYAVAAAMSFLVLCYFWRGRNWARLLVLVTALLMLPNPLLGTLGRSLIDPARPTIAWVESGFGLFLIWYLTRPSVKRFFAIGRRAA